MILQFCTEYTGKNSWRQKHVETVSLSWWDPLSVIESRPVMSFHFWIMRFLNLSDSQCAFAPCLRCLRECLFASDSEGPLQHCCTVTGYEVWDDFIQTSVCEYVPYTVLGKKVFAHFWKTNKHKQHCTTCNISQR